MDGSDDLIWPERAGQAQADRPTADGEDMDRTLAAHQMLAGGSICSRWEIIMFMLLHASPSFFLSFWTAVLAAS